MSDVLSTLNADKPGSDPAQDLFGHAPFARTLATAIAGYNGTEGIVLALYGPWGSGKSTVLAFVEHELDRLQEHARPVIVDFNPWWFSGQEHLARAFLGQMQAVLPAKYAGFKRLGDKLAEFSGAIGGAVDVASAAFGIPFGGKALEAGARLLASKPKDVPGLKKSISDLLLEQKKRVLVLIDDIDRLAPDEVRQLFTVIKALGDFPYVTYLLAFDREVAASAINQQTGLPGERFLEKIIQVPFELPRVDRTILKQALFARLDSVMAGTPEGRFDPGHWQNIFWSGLDPLFIVPRDVVRLTNALSVTYPAVVGEVNPVDFIAIECLRVFLPSVYDAIRTSPEQFTGYTAHDQHSKQQAQTFHGTWLSQVPEHLRSTTKEMMERLFPRLESVWSNMHYSGDSFQEWRRNLRVCTGGDIFFAYFRLSLPSSAVSRSDIDALLAVANDPPKFAELLGAAATQKLPTGISKARTLLERVMDHVPELAATQALPVIAALFRVGDELLLPSDMVPGSFDFGNESRVSRIAYHLLKKVEPPQRLPLLTEAFKNASAIRCTKYLFSALDDEAQKAAKGDGESLLDSQETEMLKPLWRERVEQLAQTPAFIAHPSLGSLLSGWRHWGGEIQAREWAQQAIQSDQGLVNLVSAFATQVTSQGFGDHAIRVTWRVRPKSLEPYIDLDTSAARLQTLSDAGIELSNQAAAVKDFLRRWARIKAGMPDNDSDIED